VTPLAPNDGQACKPSVHNNNNYDFRISFINLLLDDCYFCLCFATVVDNLMAADSSFSCLGVMVPQACRHLQHQPQHRHRLVLSSLSFPYIYHHHFAAACIDFHANAFSGGFMTNFLLNFIDGSTPPPHTLLQNNGGCEQNLIVRYIFLCVNHHGTL
jgi:hypothetical protein